MEVIKPRERWTIKFACDHCNAMLLVDEHDLKARNDRHGVFFVCCECNKENTVYDSNIPKHIRDKVWADRIKVRHEYDDYDDTDPRECNGWQSGTRNSDGLDGRD